MTTNEATARVAERTSKLLADSYTLYLKTHNFHWNVTGPMFSTLHTMFETQYTELALAVDEIAERIRALGSTNIIIQSQRPWHQFKFENERGYRGGFQVHFVPEPTGRKVHRS